MEVTVCDRYLFSDDVAADACFPDVLAWIRTNKVRVRVNKPIEKIYIDIIQQDRQGTVGMWLLEMFKRSSELVARTDVLADEGVKQVLVSPERLEYVDVASNCLDAEKMLIVNDNTDYEELAGRIQACAVKLADRRAIGARCETR